MKKGISNIVCGVIVVTGIAALTGCISLGGGGPEKPEKKIILTENAISHFSISGRKALKEGFYTDAFDRCMEAGDYIGAEKALVILNYKFLYSVEGLKPRYDKLESAGYHCRPCDKVLDEVVTEGLIKR